MIINTSSLTIQVILIWKVVIEMTDFERQIQEHGVLASYTYVKLLYSYYVLKKTDAKGIDSKMKVKRLLKDLAVDINASPRDLGQTLALPKELMEEQIYDFVKNLDFFDELFKTVSDFNKVDLITLVKEQIILKPYSTVGLTASKHYYAISERPGKYLRFNGFSVFVYLVRFNEITAHDAVSLFGKLLIQPYLLIDELEYEDYSVSLKAFYHLNIPTEQIYLYPVYSGEPKNNLIFLPLNIPMDAFQVGYMRGKVSSTNFVDTVEKILHVSIDTEYTDDALNWTVSTQAWTTQPDKHLIYLMQDLSEYDRSLAEVISYVPTHKSFCRFLPLLMDNCYTAGKAPSILVDYLTSTLGNGTTLAIKLEMSIDTRNIIIRNYLNHMIKYMGHFAELYQMKKFNKTFEELYDGFSWELSDLADYVNPDNYGEFTKVPSLELLTNILLYFKYNDVEDLVSHFNLLNSVYKCIVYNQEYWWGLTSPLTGYKNYFVAGISNDGLILACFTLESGVTFKAMFNIISNRVVYATTYFIDTNIESSIPKDVFDLMFQGEVVYCNGFTMQPSMGRNKQFTFSKLVFDPWRCCVYPFRDVNCLEKSVCYLPYNIALAEENTIQIGDRFYSLETYSDTYCHVNEPTKVHNLLPIEDKEIKANDNHYETQLFEEVFYK